MILSVVILNFNTQFFLELCLECVQQATAKLDAEIIVVDNASSDDSCNLVKTYFPQVKLICNKENVGFSKGNNIGVHHAKGHYVCLLNPDTVISDNTFEIFISEIEKIDNPGILGPQLIDGSGHFLPESKRGVPTPKTALFRMLNAQRFFPDSKILNAYYAPHIQKDDIKPVGILVGACMFMKRQTYLDLGGLDEDYFMYGEDIDLSYKALKNGLTNYYIGSIQLIHFKGESTLKNQSYRNHFSGAMKLFYQKHFKSYFLMRPLVLFGIRCMSFQKTKASSEKKVQISQIWIPEKVRDLKDDFSQYFKDIPVSSYHFIDDFGKNTNHALVVFDLTNQTFADCLAIMTNLNKRKNTFAFLSKRRTFMLESPNAETRGNIYMNKFKN
ncbi:MAG: glycosyltransferase family 2 protein [Flavobacteriaceae bacterium]|nr:glycosyltransferase family 2 protein [Flavobacteriaceae bacterium]